MRIGQKKEAGGRRQEKGKSKRREAKDWIANETHGKRRKKAKSI